MSTRLSNTITETFLVAAFVAGTAMADDSAANPLARLKSSYAATLQRIEKEYADTQKNCRKGYPAALNTKEILFRRAGDLDGVMAIRAEKERYAKEKTVPEEPPPGADDNVIALQITYHKAMHEARAKHDREILRTARLYLEQLESLKTNLTRAGKIEQALKVRSEQERVRKNPVVTAAAFATANRKAAASPAAAGKTARADTGPTRCTACTGSGRCSRCKGSGLSSHSLLGSRTRGKCIRCLGSRKCKTCNGTGWVDADGKSAQPPTAPRGRE